MQSDMLGARSEFGRYALDHDNRQLLRDGRRIALDPKALVFLELLLRRPGALTSAAYLRRALWPDVHVGAGALRRVAAAVRGALDDDGKEPSWIETRRGVGYLFRGQVRVTASSDARPTSAVQACTPFVGRSRELAAARALVESAAEIAN